MPTRNLILLLLLAMFSAVTVSAGKQVIQFDRPIKVGQVFECHTLAAHDESHTIKGGQEAQTSKSSAQTKIKGLMTVLKVTPKGSLAKIEFKVQQLVGQVNGKPITPDLVGKTLVIDLARPALPDFQIKGSDQQLSRPAIQLLAIVFRSSNDVGLKEILGTEEAVEPGDTWQPPTDLIKQSLKLRKFDISKAKFNGQVALTGTEDVKGTTCWNIAEQLTVSGVEGLKFSFQAQVLLPVDPKAGSTRKLLRHGSEEVTKVLPAGNPMLAGKTLISRISSRMEATIIPVSE